MYLTGPSSNDDYLGHFKNYDYLLTCPSVDTSALFAFPHTATAFRRHNATLPSSAAVERLFSVAGQIMIPRRCKMSDTVFEQTVFLRYKV